MPTSPVSQPAFGFVEGINEQPRGCYQLTSLGSAVGLTTPTSAVGDGANCAYLQAETQNVRFRDDGTAPTASVGTLLVAGAAPTRYLGDLSAIKLIETTASAKLNVTLVKVTPR